MTLKIPSITSVRLLLSLGKHTDVPAIIKFYTDNRNYLTPFYPQWHQDFFTEEFWNQQVELNLQVFFHYKSLKLFIYPQINLNKIIDTINFHNFIGAVFNINYFIL